MATYGSGHFGHWITDDAGLPAYEYTCDHLHDPAAEYATRRDPSHDHFHLLGNFHASAIAHNEGYVELFRPDTTGCWLNRYAPRRGAYAGGFGFLRIDRQIRSTLYRHLASPRYRRIWGVGYFRKSATWGDLAIDQVTFMPYGNDPVLLNLTTLGNRGLRPLSLSYVEYWDVLVTPVARSPGRAWRHTRYDPQRRLLLCSPVGAFRGPGAPLGGHDPDPPAVFLAAVDGLSVAAVESSRAVFFGEGGLDGPTALEVPFLAGHTFPRGMPGDGIVLTMQREVTVPPRGQKTLAHLYGYGSWDSARRDASGSATPAGLVERYAARSPHAWFEESRRSWREGLIRFEAPRDAWVAREAAWNSYYAQALAALDAYTGETYLGRGGSRTYLRGLPSSPRDSCRQALALLANNPAQVRGTIRHLTRLCRPDGSLLHPRLRRSFPPGLAAPEPSDLQLWLLWLIADYILFYRDRAFADQEVPLYPQSARQTTTIRQQVRRGLDHLRRVVGLGWHGLLRLHGGDEQDVGSLARGFPEQWRLRRQGESTLSSGLAGVVLPRVAQLCRWLGETAWAQEVEQWTSDNRQGLAEAWNGHWFDRVLIPNGYPLGRRQLYLDCQPWIVLAGAANDVQQFILFHEIHQRLAERSPSGSGHDRVQGSGLNGGLSFAVSGPLVWALAQADPSAAWAMLKRCTLASHAEALPRRWFGIWSGPDSLDSAASSECGGGAGPLRRWLPRRDGVAPQHDFPIADGHSASQLLFALARLAGLQADAQGFHVQPRLPFERFAFEAARLGLRWQEGCVEGYLVPQGNDAVLIRVDYPQPFVGRPRVLVNRRSVTAQLSADGRQVSFQTFLRGGLRTEWQIRAEPEDCD